MNKKQKRGITLISLVITVILLIILAGVAIGYSVNKNGIFNKAKEVVNKQNDKVAKEENIIDEVLNYDEQEQSEIITAQIEVTNRGEDTITVRVNGTNLNKYQFSIDGVKYTEEQSKNEYTFTGLNKVIVNETNYKTAKGNEYTIYAKVKSILGTEVTCTPVKTSTIVEVIGNAEKFIYEDLGNEIYITGINTIYDIANASKIPSSGMNSEEFKFIEDPNIILIPNKINGKPVTKVSKELFMQNINKTVSGTIGTIRIVICNAEDGSFITFHLADLNPTENVHTWYDINMPMGNVNLYMILGNMYANTNTVITRATREVTLEAKIKSSEIILPPTINEIKEDTVAYKNINDADIIKTNNENNILKQPLQLINNNIKLKPINMFSKISVEKSNIYTLAMSGQPTINLDALKLTNILSPLPTEKCNIYTLGKNNSKDILNGEILSNLTSYNCVTVNFVN